MTHMAQPRALCAPASTVTRSPVPAVQAGHVPLSIECRASWRVAAAAVALLTIAAGAPLTVVVAMRPIAETMGARSLPALASALAYLGAGIGGLLFGLAASRFGHRRVAFAGGLAAGCGLFVAAQGEAWQLLLGIGLGVGLIGNGALFAPMVTYVSQWFDRRRGTALALVASGQYLAGVVWPPVFERAVAQIGWQRTMMAYGLFAVVAITPIALLALRPLPAPVAAGPLGRGAPGGVVLGVKPRTFFLLLNVCIFLCCAPMAMPASHLVAFCADLGIPARQGAAMLAVLLLAAFVSRQGWGWLSDRIGGLWTVMLGSLAQVTAMVAFLLTQDEAGLFFVAAAYGLGFSGILPAYLLAVRASFPATEAAWRIPTVMGAGLAGMAAGAWGAGVIYDTLGFYAAAWAAGIAFNVVQLAVLAHLLARQHRDRSGLPLRPREPFA